MKKTFTIIILFLLCEDVFGDEVKSVSVMSGDSVTLHTDITELQEDEMILWRFGEGESKNLLVEMTTNKIWYTGEKFINKLNISDTQTGDLTIKNMKIKYSGLYEAEINLGTETLYKRFNVTVFKSPSVINDGPCEVTSFTVTEGESVTLPCNVQTQRDDLILWRFGDERALIAEVDMEDDMISLFDDTDGSFSDRLKLNDQTGDLTITDCKTKHSGVYQLKIIRNKQTLYKIFSVIVRGAGSSLGVIAGLCVFFLLVIAAVIAAGLILYRHKISKLLVPVDEQKSLVPCSEMEAEMRDYELKEVTYTVDKNTQKQQDSVCAADINEEMIRTGKLGESVTLDTCVTEIQRDDEILWMFEDTTIAEYTGGTNEYTLNKTDERFNDKLEMNHQTGDLTIKSMRSELTGVYKVQIKNSSGNKERKFIVALYVQPTKGKCNTLCTKVKINKGDKVEWISKDKTSLVTGMNGEDSKTSYTNDERFRDRLKMNAQTGNLIIRDIRQTDEGVYTLKLIKADGKITYRLFHVDLLGVPTGYFVKGSLNYTSQRERDKASQNLLKPQNSDGQKSLVQSSEMEAEMRDDELKEETNKSNLKTKKQQKSDEVKSVSVMKGDQAETDQIDKKPLKQQNSVGDMKGGLVTPSESKKKEGDEWEQTSEDKTSLVTGMNEESSKRDRQQMNRETEDPSITDTSEKDKGVFTPQLINTDGDVNDSAGVSDESVMVTMPLLEAADRFSTSPMHRSLNLPQGSQTRFVSGWRLNSFYR